MARKKESSHEYALASRIIYRTLWVIGIITTFMFIVFVPLKRVLIGIVSFLFDADIEHRVIKWLVNLYGEIFSSVFGMKQPSTDWIPHTDQWSNKLTHATENSGMNMMIFLFIVFLVLLLAYVFTIVMRHHKGEMAPLLNDFESRRMRRKIIRKIDAGYLNRSGDDKGNKKKYSRLEKKVQRHIRLRLKVIISTSIPNGYPMPIKQYHIRIRRGRTTKITNKVLNYIKDLDTELTDITGGISFDQMKQESNRRYFIYEGSQEKELKEARSVIKNREKMQNRTDDSSLSGEGDNRTEYNFPLDILSEDPEKIKRRAKRANKYAEENQGTIDQVLASLNIQVEAKKPNVGNSAIEYIYGMRFSQNSKSHDDIIKTLEQALRTQGITIYTRAENMIINVPLPEKSRIPIDGGKLIQAVFEEEVENPTHAVLGQTVDNKPLDFVFSEGPHTLMGGTSGSGKSVASKFFLSSMLAKGTPKELQMQIIDPKQADFVPFNKSPFNLTDVITDIKNDVVPFMKYVVIVMEERYKMFKEAGGTENIEEYNEWAEENGKEKLPYIVIFMDEVSDMMNQVQDEIETPIQRLGQMGRASGVHLIMSTQRPSREVITGLIKTNLATRLALSVKQDVDSRIILDEAGAETLKGKGDMLFAPQGSMPIRAQGANITRKQLIKMFESLNEKFEKQPSPDYHAIVERAEAEEKGEEYSEENNETFGAISALQQSRLDIEKDSNTFNEESVSKSSGNRRKTDDERSQEEITTLQKAIDNRERRKNERKNKVEKEKKPTIKLDTASLVRDSELADKKVEEDTDKKAPRMTTAERLGL
ncbi:FtsK/SpoIIIE domain-containing protein [Staphylococcus shinii]|uniref:FtsK/SpoIIIE domain-containing protein n=1 Tax=Staphylococcus shinii TaxID=2912228 RepID=UPI003EEC37A3